MTRLTSRIGEAVMRRLGIDDKQIRRATVLSRISWAKNHMLDPQEIYLQSGDPKTEKRGPYLEDYKQELRSLTPSTSTTCCCTPCAS